MVTELSAKSVGIRKQNTQYKKHIDVLCSDRRLQFIYARENARLPGGRKMRPEIKSYVTNNRKNAAPVIRQSVVVPKKIIYKSSPRPVKSKIVPVTRKAVASKLETSAGKIDKAAAEKSPRIRTAKVRKTQNVKSDSMVPYDKEPSRSTKRFLDQSFNVYSTERKMSKLKV